MNQFLEQRIANLMGPEPTYNDPMMMAQGGEVFDIDDPETMAEASMAMGQPVTDPNAELRAAMEELMMAQETADDPFEAAKAQQLMEAAQIGSEAPMGTMAMELSEAGRGGDTMLAHLTPGEVILPLGMMDDPEFERVVENRFNQLDLAPEEYVAGLGIASLNPVTGLEEFGFFKKIAKGVKKVVKKVVRPIASVAQFIPGPWQPFAAIINKAGTVYDVAKGRASPLALASLGAPIPGGGNGGGIGSLFSGAKEFVTKGADGVGLLGNIGKGISGLGRNVSGLVTGGGADGVGSFGKLGDFAGGIGDTLGVTDYASMRDPGAVLGQLSVNNPEITEIVQAGVSSGKSMGDILSEVEQMGYGGSGGGFMKVVDAMGGMGGGAMPMGSEDSITIIQNYLAQFPDQQGGINAMLASGVTEDELAAELMGLPEFQASQAGSQQQGGSFFGMRTPDAIRGIEDSIKDMLGMNGAPATQEQQSRGLAGLLGGGGGGGLNMGALGAAGLAGLIGKLAYDEAKDRKGVPLTPSVVMNAAGRFNLENEIARRSGTAAPNPVEFGLLPQGTLPTLSGGRAPTTAQAELEAQKATGMRYGGPVMAFAEGGNVDEQDFKRMNGDINGEGTEVSDDIPAMLSDGEFVMTGRAVRGAGAFNMKNKNGIITLTPKNGEDRDRGTKLMYDMMGLFKEFAEEPEAVA